MRISLENDKKEGPQREPRRYRFVIHAEVEMTDEEIFDGWEEVDEDGDPIPRDFEASPLSMQEIVSEIKERYWSTLEMADTWQLHPHFTLEVLPAQPDQPSQVRSA